MKVKERCSRREFIELSRTKYFMHYVYRITNLLNNKIYIGRRKHHSPSTDAYMGSGTQIKTAIKKYGISYFKKEILAIFDIENDAASLEASLVTKDFCLREDTYNMHEGGYGGFTHINDNPGKRAEASRQSSKRNKELGNGGKKNWLPGTQEYCAKIGRNKFAEIQHLSNTKEALAKKKATWAVTKHSQGKNNSQFGTMWITDGTHSRKISKDSSIPEGWEKGRVINSVNLS